MQDLLRTLVEWIEIPSVTGDEGDYGDALGRALEARGFDVERQEVQPGRFNLLARAGRPEVVFCTHLDTVPPYFGARQDADFIHGRGSCDAKGQAAAMLAAGTRLLASGEDRIGFLFTVGEETDSAGAERANAQLADPWAPRWTVIGEPTDSTFISGHKGLFKACLAGHGVAGHSSQDVGPSALHEMIGAMGRLLAQDWGNHPTLGRGTINVGCMRGGVAANVNAAQAEAEVLLRIVEDPTVVEQRLRASLGEHVTLELVSNRCGPVEFHVPAGEEGVSAAFGTDAPHLANWGTPLLFGAGSIRDAHTDHEKVGVKELIACSLRHERTVRELLAGD